MKYGITLLCNWISFTALLKVLPKLKYKPTELPSLRMVLEWRIFASTYHLLTLFVNVLRFELQ